MTTLASGKRWILLGFLAAGLGACAPPDVVVEDGLPATLALVSPGSPLGLNYGQSATLELAYKLHGEPRAGVTLYVSADGDDGGATLSTAKVVTNDRGEASALLTAGAAESAFHVLVTVPQAKDLVIDVAVSRYAFGTLNVELDATTEAPTAVAVEAGLFTDQGCADLPTMAKLMGALRSMRRAARHAELLFPKLLLHDYTVVGRAEDKQGRLVALGCVGMPERLLKSGVQVPLTVPLQPVFLSPVGSYTVKSELQLHVQSPLFSGLACRYGLGQTLLDALIAAAPPASRDVAMRLQAARAATDGKGCRGTGMSGEPPDQSAQTLLAATSAGLLLGPVAVDLAAVQNTAVLKSGLDIRGSATTRWVGDHTLTAVTLQSSTMNATYPLVDLPTPTARELPLVLRGNLLTVPAHRLSLQLPRLWRRALQDLVLGPRGVSMTPAQLWQAAVNGARSGTTTGCEAIEAVLCSKLAAPCKGLLQGACLTGSANVAAALLHALDDAPPQLDLEYGVSVNLDDPDDALQAKSLTAGQASGEVELGSGPAAFTATVNGTRRAD